MPEPGLYRKKPVVIKAVQWHGTEDDFRALIQGWPEAQVHVQPTIPLLFINTKEGIMKCEPGDWILQGVEGEFYSCKDSIFKKTYEPE